MAQSDKVPTLTSIVSESFPHLRRGAMRDFLMIMMEHRYFKDARWNKSESTYTFETGSKIEFFSADQADKLRGARRDRLFLNEANQVPFDAFEQLEVRTKDFIFIDYNPTNQFWVFDEVMPKRKDWEQLILTYKDNEALSPQIISSIEARKNRKGWWQVYGMGQLGEVEGKIYTGWEILDEVPKEARLERYGLDFGFSNDPSSIVAVFKWNGAFIFDEICYQKGLSNRQLADILLNNEAKLVIADSAEPKSIAEIKEYGVMIIGALKGKDSVVHGIQFIQDQKCFITKRSANIIREYRNYLWMTDKDGKILNEPEHTFSHSMDCLIEGTLIETKNGKKPIENITKDDYVYTRKGLKKVKDSWKIRENADVINIILSDGRELTGTSNHRIFANGGWKYLRDIRYGDILEIWEKGSNTITESIGDTQRKINFISITGINFYIDKYGKIIMGRFQKIFMFIIKTATRLITGLRILNLCKRGSMVECTMKKESLLKKFVTAAQKNLNAKQKEKQIDSALINVKANGGGTIILMLLKRLVRYVKIFFYRLNGSKLHTAPISVEGRRELKGHTVYEITVDDCNEYFANGILVHNSIRYALSAYRPDGSEHEYQDAVNSYLEKETDPLKIPGYEYDDVPMLEY